MKYEEESLEINEQIVCLGVVQTGIDQFGQPAKYLSTINLDSISESFYEENNWTNQELSFWKDLCQCPSILVSDDRTIFQVSSFTHIFC